MRVSLRAQNARIHRKGVLSILNLAGGVVSIAKARPRELWRFPAHIGVSAAIHSKTALTDSSVERYRTWVRASLGEDFEAARVSGDAYMNRNEKQRQLRPVIVVVGLVCASLPGGRD